MDLYFAHDWRGRPYMQTVRADGQIVSLVLWSEDGMLGHGPVPRAGDRVILRSGNDWGSRYVVTQVKSSMGEGDVMTLDAKHDPRSHEQIVADIERFGRSKPKPVVF